MQPAVILQLLWICAFCLPAVIFVPLGAVAALGRKINLEGWQHKPVLRAAITETITDIAWVIPSTNMAKITIKEDQQIKYTPFSITNFTLFRPVLPYCSMANSSYGVTYLQNVFKIPCTCSLHLGDIVHKSLDS
ncbi:hypothetical protein BD414DRAFT_507850 [Trametes punicea]|nr:hypothetical protein BD414DRAFT_507850 [Trametes punicea]